MNKSRRRRLPAKKLLLGLVAAACTLGAGATSLSAAGPHYADWQAPVNLGATINTPAAEGGPALSKNGLSLYFHSTRPGGFGSFDLWVSQRERGDDDWGTPVNLGPTINSASSEQVPAFSRDGHWMFFADGRPGGFGDFDIWASWRPQTHDDFGWQAPVNLGPNINSPSSDFGPSYLENDDGGAPQLFFGSRRPGGLGESDLYMSELQADGSWGPATPLPELSSVLNDTRPTVRHDGLEIFIQSTRSGGSGADDLWVATRETVDAPWSPPGNLGPGVNNIRNDFAPYLASDRETLYFSSNRDGGFGNTDLYMTTRSKSHGGG